MGFSSITPFLPMAISDRFSESSVEAIQHGQTVARELRKKLSVTTGDILAGILIQGKSRAARVMRENGLTMEALRSVMPEFAPGVKLPSKSPIGDLNAAAETTRAFLKACELADGRRSHDVLPEDLFIAILSDPNWEATVLLTRLNVNPQTLRATIMNSNGGGALAPSGKRSTGYLDEVGVNLTALANQGKLEPVIGRQSEIKQCVEILRRYSRNNPVLIGEPGVGKTAIIYGLAQSKLLAGKQIYLLSLGKLIAGSKYRGEFEERIQKILDAVEGRDDLVLVFDEIHKLVGGGSAEGSMTAADMLKERLEKGLMCIGATTTDEYRKGFEIDAALARRFNPVKVAAPSVEETVEILRGLRPTYEAHHSKQAGITVRFTDEALVAAAVLTDRYVPDRQLPAKAIDATDTAAARRTVGAELTPDVHELVVAEEHIAAVVTETSGVPVNKLTESESDKLLHMEEILHQGVIGQDDAVKAVSSALRISRAGLGTPGIPDSFIFQGPTGVGKTELAKVLARHFFGSEEYMIRFDMSEFMERHSVSKLIGSPPGYVGFNEAGQLTNAVRQRPHTVLLFDEIEKAHPDVFNLFLQVLDDGRLTDSKGRVVDFSNTLIIFTTNIGSSQAFSSKASSSGGLDLNRGKGKQEENEKRHVDLKKMLEEAIRGHFRPEFLNRISKIVTFRQLTREEAELIIPLQLKDLRASLAGRYGVQIELTPSAVQFLLDNGFDAKYGARSLRRVIQSSIRSPLAEKLLEGNFSNGDTVLVDFPAGAKELAFSLKK